MSAEIPQRACIDMRKYLLHVFVIAVLLICLGGCTYSNCLFYHPIDTTNDSLYNEPAALYSPSYPRHPECDTTHRFRDATKRYHTAPLAFKPYKILPVHVNPLQYEQYDCSQIGTEMESVTRQLDQLHLDVKKRRKTDSNALLIGLAKTIAGGAPPPPSRPSLLRYCDIVESQYAQLIGELEVLEKASIQKKCDKKMLPEIPEYRKDFSAFTNKRFMVFHKYECQHRNEDTLEYKSAKEARDAGGRPCIHCKPSDMTKTQKRLKRGR